MTLTSQAYGDNFGPLPASYPENKTMQLFFSYDQAGSTMDNTEGYMHLGFFDAKTNNPIKNVSFFLNVTKGNQQLLYNLFYTYSGNFTLKLQNGGPDQKWNVLITHDPMFIGGLESSDDQLSVNIQIPSKKDLYHFEIEPIIFDESRGVYDEPSGLKFDVDFNLEQNFNTTIMPYTLPEFPLAVPILLISITSLIVFYRIRF